MKVSDVVNVLHHLAGDVEIDVADVPVKIGEVETSIGILWEQLTMQTPAGKGDAATTEKS